MQLACFEMVIGVSLAFVGVEVVLMLFQYWFGGGEVGGLLSDEVLCVCVCVCVCRDELAYRDLKWHFC